MNASIRQKKKKKIVCLSSTDQKISPDRKRKIFLKTFSDRPTDPPKKENFFKNFSRPTDRPTFLWRLIFFFNILQQNNNNIKHKNEK